jgi:MFS family permease
MPAASTVARVRRRATISCLAVAPVLITVGFAIAPDDSGGTAAELGRWSDHRGLYLFGALLASAGLALMVPGSVALLRLFRERCAVAGWIFCTLLGVGAISMAAGSMLVGIIETIGTGSDVSRASAVDLIHAAENNAAGGIPWFVGMLMFVGFLGVAVTTLVAKSAPWWQPALLIVGSALVFFSGSGAVAVAMGLPIMAAFIALARTIDRQRIDVIDLAGVDVTGRVPAQQTPVDKPSRSPA